jgi:hypothetical protein
MKQENIEIYFYSIFFSNLTGKINFSRKKLLCETANIINIGIETKFNREKSVERKK